MFVWSSLNKSSFSYDSLGLYLTHSTSWRGVWPQLHGHISSTSWSWSAVIMKTIILQQNLCFGGANGNHGLSWTYSVRSIIIRLSQVKMASWWIIEVTSGLVQMHKVQKFTYLKIKSLCVSWQVQQSWKGSTCDLFPFIWKSLIYHKGHSNSSINGLLID